MDGIGFPPDRGIGAEETRPYKDVLAIILMRTGGPRLAVRPTPNTKQPMKPTLTLLTALALAGSAYAGQRVASDSKMVYSPEPECFRAGELQLDIFGQYTDGNAPFHAGTVRDHGWGGGIGVNYFITKNFGVGVDAAWLAAKEAPYSARNNDLTAIHNFSGSLIYRFTMDSKCIAPYVFAGGGVAVNGHQWATVHGGAGVEWRVKPQKLGVFTDARWTYMGERFNRGDINNISARVGVRIVF